LFLSEIIFLFVLKQFKSLISKSVAIYSIATLGYIFGLNKCILPWGLDVAMVVQIFLFVGYLIKNNKIHINNLVGIMSLTTLIIILVLL
jgi:hypothetical protein